MHSHIRTSLGIAALILAAAAQAASSGGGKAYKWVDEKGVTHYGDVIPPEFSRQGRSELNQQGVAVRQFPAQMSEAEAAAAQKSAAEESRLRQHDRFLLTTYTTAGDIEQLRDERVALIDSQMSIARGSIDSVNGRLKTLETRMRNFKPYSKSESARQMPDRLAEEVVRTLQERRSLEDALKARETEKIELRTGFDADLARYRELTAARKSP
jgi:hypothetical protein